MKIQTTQLLQNHPNPHIVIVGGGFAGLTLLNALANANFKVTLIDRNNFHTFQPLLYQVATASLSADSIGYPFRRTIGAFKNISFLMAEVDRVDDEQKIVFTNKGEIAYDLLVIATGSVTNFFGNAQIAANAMQLKSISQALDIRSVFLQEFEKAVLLSKKHDQDAVKRILNFVIVGAGPTGVEVSGALAEIRRNILRKEYPEINPELMCITLLDAGPRVLGAMSEKSGQTAKSYLLKMGVDVRTGTLVQSYDGEKVVLANGNEIDTQTVIWSAGVKGNAVEGFGKDTYTGNGRLVVNRYNEVKNLNGVFALGDAAFMETDLFPKGHPMMAQPAIQQANLLARNLKRVRDGKAPKMFEYRDKGSMATIGRNKAVADLGKINLGGTLAWYVWMVVHVMSLIGFRNKLAVLFNWAVKYFSYKNTIRLIIRPYNRKM